MAEGPETNRQRQSVESVSGLGNVLSVQRVAGFCKRCWNIQKHSTFASKIAEISLDLLESCRISPNMVKILRKSAWISSNLTGSHQIWLRSRRISLNLSLILPELLDLYITSVESGGSGFGEENPPRDPSASGLGHKNPSPTDESVGSG